MEQLKAMSEIAVSRTLNWQSFVATQPRLLAFLVKAAICLDEAISPILLQVRLRVLSMVPGSPPILFQIKLDCNDLRSLLVLLPVSSFDIVNAWHLCMSMETEIYEMKRAHSI